jgi:UDP-glucuronate 4-epimerase
LRALVTGGAGFIGSHVVRALLGRGDTIACLDNFNDYYSPERKRLNVAPFLQNRNFSLVEADIRDAGTMQEIFSAGKFDKVVHLAAMAGVRKSIENPKLYEEVNIGGTLNLLDCAVKNQINDFVFASSSSVYGVNEKVPFAEDDRVDNPISPHAATKRAAELMAKTYHHLYGMRCTGLRFFTVYGPGGRPDMAPYLFTKWISEGKPVKVFGDGSSRRDYTYVDDIVQGVVAAVDAGYEFEIFNLGDSRTVELREFIHAIEQALGLEAQLEFAPMQAGDVPVTYADISKAKRMLGYEPQTSVEEGIARFVDWYRQEVMAVGRH